MLALAQYYIVFALVITGASAHLRRSGLRSHPPHSKLRSLQHRQAASAWTDLKWSDSSAPFVTVVLSNSIKAADNAADANSIKEQKALDISYCAEWGLETPDLQWHHRGLPNDPLCQTFLMSQLPPANKPKQFNQYAFRATNPSNQEALHVMNNHTMHANKVYRAWSKDAAQAFEIACLEIPPADNPMKSLGKRCRIRTFDIPGEPEGRCMGAIDWDSTKATAGSSMHEAIIFDECAPDADMAAIEARPWQLWDIVNTSSLMMDFATMKQRWDAIKAPAA